MSNLHWPDLAIVAGYMALMAGIGMRFSKRQTTTEAYFVAKRSVPPWAMGLSLLATLISSVTFVAYPGSAYANDWSLLAPGFMLWAVLALAGTLIIPFYREQVGMSAYEYFGKRFGRPARIYGSIAFTLAHFSKMGFVVYLLGLTINSMTGWPVDLVIVIASAVTIFYAVIGGLEAVIWTDVIQGFVMGAGVIVCLGYLLFLPAGGPAAVFASAAANHKFSFGSWTPDFTKQSIPVLLIYGFFWYGQRYVADQTLVQRYLTAKSDRDALKGVSLGAGLCVPVWALFMLIGTCTWSFYKLTGEKLPAYIAKADQVFPYFLATHLPAGMAGLFMAALTGSAMSLLASDLNCLAAVGVQDMYRFARPNATDRECLRVGKSIVAVFGCLAAATGIKLARRRQRAIDVVFGFSNRVRRTRGPVPVGLPEQPREPQGRVRGHRFVLDLHRVGDAHHGRQTGDRPGTLQLPVARLHGGRDWSHRAGRDGISGQSRFPQRRRRSGVERGDVVALAEGAEEAGTGGRGSAGGEAVSDTVETAAMALSSRPIRAKNEDASGTHPVRGKGRAHPV